MSEDAVTVTAGELRTALDVDRERLAGLIATAIVGLPNGGGVTWNEALAIGERVARLAIDMRRETLGVEAGPAGICSHAWETDSDVCPECGADWSDYLNRRIPRGPRSPGAEAGLDVDRLARAIEAVGDTIPEHAEGGGYVDLPSAEAVAAEYARLASPADRHEGATPRDCPECIRLHG